MSTGQPNRREVRNSLAFSRGSFRKISRGGQKWNVADFGGGGGTLYKEVCFAHLMLGGGAEVMLPQENFEF